MSRLVPTTLSVAALVAACGAATDERPAETARSTERGAAADDAPPLLFGVALGASAEELGRALPGLELRGTEHPGLQVGVAEVELQGRRARLRLELVGGRLFSVSLQVRGDGLDVEAFERLGRSVSEQLGQPARGGCVSEDGVSFAQFLADGWGSRRFSWRRDLERGHIRLFGLGPLAEATIEGRFEHLPLLEQYRRLLPDDPDLLKSGAKEVSGGCTVSLDGAEPASFLGLAFGATMDEAQAAVGGERRADRLHVEREVAGVPVEVILSFYSGCLATVTFLSRGTEHPEEDYRAILAFVRQSMPSGIARRCEGATYEGGPELMLDTLWRDAGPVEGHLTFGWDPHFPVVLELAYAPLRSHAPRIDF